MSTRCFLFLQGNASWFFRRLADALAQRGHGVRRINICGGDWWFWGDWNAVDYTGSPGAIGPFAAELARREGVTDVVLHNDTRPVHRAALDHLTPLGITPWVFEEGYLRPHWLTLERGGINGFSGIPRDSAWIREEAARLGPAPEPVPVGAGTRWRVLYDFRWQWANYRYVYRWPRYRTHRPYPIWAEYATWLRRLATLKWRQAQARRTAETLIQAPRPFFLLPLQLDSDSQIRLHSPFGRLHGVLDHVIADFAANAPGEARLLIKNHPLDNGWINWRRVVGRLAKRHGAGERVIFIDGARLDALMAAARGVVTINSTAGLTAALRGHPTICLGTAIYDVPGVTAQTPLRTFWHTPPVPDPEMTEAFRRVLMGHALINGNYYTEEGMRVGLANAVSTLEGGPRNRAA